MAVPLIEHQTSGLSFEFGRKRATLLGHQTHLYGEHSRPKWVSGISRPLQILVCPGLREDGLSIGRFRMRRLMRELGLVNKQPGSHAYKQATVERPDILNRLNREFTTERPSQVWCGDITYIWAQGRWNYLAVVLDLHTRGVIGWAFSAKPDAELVIKALDMAYEQRSKPQQVLFHSSTTVACFGSDCGDIGLSRA